MRRIIKFLVYVFIVLGLTYTGVWFGGAYYAKKALPDFFKAQGGEVTYKAFDVTGFPFQVSVNLNSVNYTLPHNQAILKGAIDQAKVDYDLFSPFEATFHIVGNQVTVHAKGHNIAPQLKIEDQRGTVHFSLSGLINLHTLIKKVHFQEKDLPFIKVGDVDVTMALSHHATHQSFDWRLQGLHIEGLTKGNNPLFPVNHFSGKATLILNNEGLHSVEGQMEILTPVTHIKAQPHLIFADNKPSGKVKIALKNPRAVFRSLMDNNIFGLPFANAVYQILPRKYRQNDFIDLSLDVKDGGVDFMQLANQFLS